MLVQPDEQPNEIIELENENGTTVHTNAEQDPIVDIPIVDIPVNYGKNQILIDTVFHTPTEPNITRPFENKQRIHLQLSENKFEEDIINFTKQYTVPNIQYYLYFEKADIYEQFCEVIRKNFKWPSLKFKKCKIKLIDVTDKNDIPEIIENYHTGKTNHRGIEETEQRIKKLYYWPSMKNSIQTFINNCEICQQCKYERHPIKMKLNITPTPRKPFETVHADTFTLEQTKFLTVIDAFSKYAQAYPLESLNSTEIVNKLIIFFSHHGIPKQIIVDNGTEFKNSVIKDLLDLHKIDIHFCSPNHPQSNGVIERLHSTLIEHTRILNTRGFLKTPMNQKIIYAILAYNNSIHTTTKLKPIDVINGHINNDNPFDVDIDKALINNYIEDHKERTKLMYSHINQNLAEHKDNLIAKLNKNRDDPKIFIPENKTYIKKFIRQKTANKFSQPTSIEHVNEISKTISTNTGQNKIHMDNVKRPLKETYKFND